jgi:hypothetical protein
VREEVSQWWPPAPWTWDKDETKARPDASLERLITAERERAEAARKAAMERAWELERAQRQSLRDAEEDDGRYATR